MKKLVLAVGFSSQPQNERMPRTDVVGVSVFFGKITFLKDKKGFYVCVCVSLIATNIDVATTLIFLVKYFISVMAIFSSQKILLFENKHVPLLTTHLPNSKMKQHIHFLHKILYNPVWFVMF